VGRDKHDERAREKGGTGGRGGNHMASDKASRKRKSIEGT